MKPKQPIKVLGNKDKDNRYDLFECVAYITNIKNHSDYKYYHGIKRDVKRIRRHIQRLKK
jgi:hypothetical protein